MLSVIAYISKLEEDIDLAKGYNEYYKASKSEIEYLKCKKDIKLMEKELKQAKKLLRGIL